MKGGGGPFSLGYDAGKAYKTVFHCFWLKVDPGFDNNGNTGTKFGFSWTPLTGGANYSHYYINLFRGTTGEMGVNLESAGAVLNRNTRTKFAWAAHFGEWHKFEILTVSNSQGNADGIIRFWVDGVLDYQATNVKFFLDNVAPAGWNQFTVVGTYGGGTNLVPHNMFAYLDNYRLAGK